MGEWAIIGRQHLAGATGLRRKHSFCSGVRRMKIEVSGEHTKTTRTSKHHEKHHEIQNELVEAERKEEGDGM